MMVGMDTTTSTRCDYRLTIEIAGPTDLSEIARGLELGLENEWLHRSPTDRAWDTHGVTGIYVAFPDDADHYNRGPLGSGTVTYVVSLSHATGQTLRADPKMAEALRAAATRIAGVGLLSPVVAVHSVG